MRTCAHCGQPAVDRRPYCAFCGAALPAEDPPPQAAQPVSTPAVFVLPPAPVVRAKSRAAAVACALAAAALIGLILFAFLPPVLGLSSLFDVLPGAMNFQDGRFRERFAQWREDEDEYDVWMRGFALLARLDGVPAEDYLTASKVLRNTEQRIAILSLGITKTGDGRLLDRLDDVAPLGPRLKGYEHQKLFEEVFGKPVQELSWRDTHEIKYLSVHGRYFTYSFTSPQDTTTVTFNPDRISKVHCWMFTGCQELDVGFWLKNEEVMGKPYRSLSVRHVTGIARPARPAGQPFSVEQFAAAPLLEMLDIESEIHVPLGDTALMDGLAELRLRYWAAVGPGSLFLPVWPLEQLGNGRAPHLETLYLENYRITGAAAGDLSSLPLKTLTLNKCDLSAAAGMENLSQLEYLTIVNCQVKYYDFISTYKNLLFLRVEGCNAAPALYGAPPPGLLVLMLDGAVSLEPFAGCKNLEWLYVADENAFAYMGGFENLTQLTLRGQNLTYDFSATPVLPKLNSIDIEGHKDGYIQLSRLDELTAACPALEKLTMRYVSQTNGLTKLADVLAELHIHQSKIHYTKDIFQNAGRLRRLSLTDMRLDGETGAALLSRIGSLKALESLDVSNTAIDSLSFLRGMTGLTELTARNNYIQDASILSELPNLKSVDLSDNLLQT